MSLELSKQQITINQLVGEAFSQTLVEGDIIVPDVKPDIFRILQADGIATITDKQVQQDKVMVSGVVNFKILYVPEQSEEPIKSIYTNCNFTNTIEMKNTDDTMKAQIESDVEHIEFEMLNERKLNIKAVVAINCKVVCDKGIDLVTGISGEKDVEVLRKNVKAYNIVGEKDATFIIKEDLEIPAGKPSIKDLLKLDAKITSKDMKLISNKVIVKGEMSICCLYIADMDNNSIQFMEHEMPFTEIVDLEGVTEEMLCELEYTLEDVYYQLKEDGDGDIRMLNIESTLKINTRASEQVSLDVVIDAYSPDACIKTQSNTCAIDEILQDSKEQSTVKEIITMPIDIPDVVQIYNIITKPYVTESVVENEKIKVEGIIDTYILYLADNEENPIYSYKQEVPFEYSVDAPGVTNEMACDIKVEVEHFSYSMNAASEIEIRYILSVASKVIKTSQVELITEADAEVGKIEEAGVKPSIVIYFVQRNDTLWDIAKRYSTTIQEITSINEISENASLAQGYQLIIPKRRK